MNIYLFGFILQGVTILGVTCAAVLTHKYSKNSAGKPRQDVSPALETLSEFSETTLSPSLETLSEFSETTLSPSLETLSEFSETTLSPSLETLSEFSETALSPSLETATETSLVTLAAEPQAQEQQALSENDSFKIVDKYTGKTVLVRYIRGLKAKLIQTGEENWIYYSSIKNLLLSYNNVKIRAGFTGESYFMQKKLLAKLCIIGKTFELFLALNPNEFLSSKYKFSDESNTKKYQKVAMKLKIQSKRGLSYAHELIKLMMTGVQQQQPSETIYTFPYQTDESLIEKKLIKVVYLGDKEDAEPVKFEPNFLHSKVSQQQASRAMTDEVASTLIKTTSLQSKKLEPKKQQTFNKDIINIDKLSQNFLPYDVISLESLIAKGLISKNVNFIKVLARGYLDKPLTIKAQDFSLDAVKMIALTGGTAIKDCR